MNLERRQKVRALWAEGLTRVEIARQLGLTHHQVRHCLRDPRPYRRVYTRQLSVAVDPDMHSALQAYAERQGVSLPEAVRTFVEWGLDAA